MIWERGRKIGKREVTEEGIALRRESMCIVALLAWNGIEGRDSLICSIKCLAGRELPQSSSSRVVTSNYSRAEIYVNLQNNYFPNTRNPY